MFPFPRLRARYPWAGVMLAIVFALQILITAAWTAAATNKVAKPVKRVIQPASRPAPVRTVSAPVPRAASAPATSSVKSAAPLSPSPASTARASASAIAAALPRTPTTLDKIAPFRRCLWISRWEYETEEDVVRICTNAASARFTDIFFQVRGAGTVCYRSAIEPWAPQVSPSGADPGWDPLAVALRESHKYGLRVHAYMNALPAASSGETRGTLYNRHRSWMMVDDRGRAMSAANGWYAFVDPGLPEVRQYLAALFAEVAAKYPVDGIHLDYIRYPEERGDYSYHPAVVAQFKKLYKVTPTDQSEQWAQFRRDQVTAAVREIAQAVRQARPGVEVSASVIADVEKSCDHAFQSAVEWVSSGILNAVAPMAYSTELDRFEELCAPYRTAGLRDKIWLGVWAEPKNTKFQEELRRAIACRFGGVSVFSYQNLFPAHKSNTRARGAYEAFIQKQSQLSMAD